MVDIWVASGDVLTVRTGGFEDQWGKRGREARLGRRLTLELNPGFVQIRKKRALPKTLPFYLPEHCLVCTAPR